MSKWYKFKVYFYTCIIKQKLIMKDKSFIIFTVTETIIKLYLDKVLNLI